MLWQKHVLEQDPEKPKKSPNNVANDSIVKPAYVFVKCADKDFHDRMPKDQNAVPESIHIAEIIGNFLCGHY